MVQKLTCEREIIVIVALRDLSLASRFGDRFVLIGKSDEGADGQPEHVLRDEATGNVYGIRIEI